MADSLIKQWRLSGRREVKFLCVCVVEGGGVHNLAHTNGQPYTNYRWLKIYAQTWHYGLSNFECTLSDNKKSGGTEERLQKWLNRSI